jgi:hypothetical protein
MSRDIHRLGALALLHFPRDYHSPERYALVIGHHYREARAPAEIARDLARSARRATWPLRARVQHLRADLAWRALRRLPCRGRHSTSVTSDGACDDCRPLLLRCYPQGWTYYPGDTCPHGVYVGGCGVDLMCGACESGY